MLVGRALKMVLMAGVCASLLGGCSWLRDWPPGGGSSSDEAAPQPQVKLVQTADSTWLEPAPPPATQRVEHLVPPLPTEDRGTAERLEKLETDVADLRQNMSMIMPALTRLASSQNDIQAALARGAPAPTIAPAMMPPPATYSNTAPPGGAPVSLMSSRPAPQAATAAPSGMISGAAVRQVRFGLYPDKTRIVFDVSSNAAFSYDLDNNERLLVVNLPGIGWDTATQQQAPGAAVGAAYTATADGKGGTNVALQLRQSARVLSAQVLPPAEGKPSRVMLDIAGM